MPRKNTSLVNDTAEAGMENKEPPLQTSVDQNNGVAEEPEVDNALQFDKEQLLKSNRYSHRRDILTVLLDDGTMYSHATVNRLIQEFSEKKVK